MHISGSNRQKVHARNFTCNTDNTGKKFNEQDRKIIWIWETEEMGLKFKVTEILSEQIKNGKLYIRGGNVPELLGTVS